MRATSIQIYALGTQDPDPQYTIIAFVATCKFVEIFFTKCNPIVEHT